MKITVIPPQKGFSKLKKKKKSNAQKQREERRKGLKKYKKKVKPFKSDMAAFVREALK